MSSTNLKLSNHLMILAADHGTARNMNTPVLMAGRSRNLEVRVGLRYVKFGNQRVRSELRLATFRSLKDLILMATYIALLRAVNVGGTGKLPMSDLKAMCAAAGFRRIATYIASGNVVFASKDTAAEVKSVLESRLLAYARMPVQVFVRTAAEMRAVLRENPFATTDARLTYALFLQAKPPSDAVTLVRRRANEVIRLGRREIYVFYPAGMGQSRLVIPAADHGTARNMNTVAKLVAMSS